MTKAWMTAWGLTLLVATSAEAQETEPAEPAAEEAVEDASVEDADGPADGEPVATWRFEPRSETRAGWRFLETSKWTVTGNNLVTVAGAPVRKGPIDRLSSHLFDVTVVEVKDGKAFVIDVAIREQVSREDGELDEIGLDGVTVRVAGPPGARSIERVDGQRLKRKQKKWLQGQFGGRADQSGVDPTELLLPDGDVAVGDSWDLDMDAVQAYLGTERFALDREASHARTTLTSVDEVDGDDVGTFAFDVLIVPSAMENAEFEEAAMTVVGTAQLPVRGDLPFSAYDVDTTLRFLGAFKRGAIKANVDLTMDMHGAESRAKP